MEREFGLVFIRIYDKLLDRACEDTEYRLIQFSFSLFPPYDVCSGGLLVGPVHRP